MKKYFFWICAIVLLGIMVRPNNVQGDVQAVMQADQQTGKLAEAKANLRVVSTALETYSAANSGNYPTDMADLVNSKPAYIDKNYCDTTVDGYTYTCNLTSATYTITATPAQGGDPVSISTGGSLQ